LHPGEQIAFAHFLAELEVRRRRWSAAKGDYDLDSLEVTLVVGNDDAAVGLCQGAVGCKLASHGRQKGDAL
jgi:hypothetical protein